MIDPHYELLSVGMGRKDIIEEYLEDLCSHFNGPKSPVDPEPLRNMYEEEDYSGMVSYIRKNMLLQDMKVDLWKVRIGGDEDASAWINFPVNLPVYGTDSFKDVRVKLFIRKDLIHDGPFGIVARTISHEFSHIILESTRHHLRRSELAVDLMAMIFGFHELFLLGHSEIRHRALSYRKGKKESFTGYMKRILDLIITGKTRIISVGHLSFEEIQLANEWIKRRLIAK